MITTMNSGRMTIAKQHQRSLSQFYTNIIDIPLSTRYWEDQEPVRNYHESMYCVGFSWYYWLKDFSQITTELPTAVDIYHQVGNYEAGALSMQLTADYMVSREFISMYAWAVSIPELAFAVANITPVVAGISWYSGMMSLDTGSIIRPSGRYLGEHSVLIIGVDVNDENDKVFMVKNCMGTQWGEEGYAWITFDDMETLLKNKGEFCIPFRKNQGRKS